MANAYYEHIVVGSPQQASIFANEYTWTIMEVLRKVGAQGLTAEEIHKKVEKELGTSVSRSKVYSLLKRLYEEEWTHKYYDEKAQAWRNTLSIVWGGVYIDDEFYDIVKSKTKLFVNRVLFPALLEFIKKATEELENDSSTKKWLPRAHADARCRKCRTSHEAEEFLDALMDIACSEFGESENFKEYMRKNSFAAAESDAE